jgi:hypothetical protein
MSIESIAVCLHHSKASGTDKVVLIGIANHDGDGGAWPTIATLAKYSNVSERNTQRAIDRLIEMGEIVKHVQKGGNMSTRPDKRPNRYEVMVRCPADCDGTPQHRIGVSSVSERGVVGDTNGVSSVTERGGASDTLTIHEPSLEPSLTLFEPLANHLADWIERNGSKRPKVTPEWIREIERMHRIDNRDLDAIRQMIDWCQQDSFWRGNILSPKKLRKHYDTMRLRAGDSTGAMGWLQTLRYIESQDNELN